jgi:chromosome partitioning protein
MANRSLYDSRSRGAEAYFELAGEYMARNHIESPRSAARKAALADRPKPEVRFWPYS